MPRTRGGANGSFGLLWIRAAPPMTIARHPAAAGARIGAILKARGKVRPSAPVAAQEPQTVRPNPASLARASS